MKKLFVLLLAIVAVGAVSAQITTAISATGYFTLIDQDSNAVAGRYAGNGITFKATDKDGKFGYSWSDSNIYDSAALGPNSNWQAWGVTSYAKFIFGNQFNGDFRTTLVNATKGTYLWQLDRITGYGLTVESVSLGDLLIGLNLPIGETAAPTVDVLKKADIGARYAIKDVGTAYLLANLNLVSSSNIITFGFKLTAIENLTAVLLYKGTFATASTHLYAIGAYYTMDKLDLALEVDGKYATELDTEVLVQASYQVTDDLSAAVDVLYDLGGTYDAWVTVDYNLMSKVFAELTAGYADTGIHYDLSLYYGVSF
jgi:hypothetical protein